jgi:cytochrome c-type biogenesis protein CcmH/NrfG
MTNPRIRVTLILSLALMACGHDAGTAKQSALQKGRQFYQRRNYGDAEIQFRKAIREDARFGEAWLWLGRTENQRGNYRAAFDGLTEAVALLPGQDAPKVELANMMLVAWLGNPGRPAVIYDQITRISDALLARNLDSFDGARLKGYLAMGDSTPAKAAEYFDHANRVRPNEPDVITGLAESLL